MCGILGYIGRFSPDALARGNSCQAHRGPDDSGTYVRDGVGLAHRRLSIQDLSEAGHQPMHSADGQLVLVFNGEIYNFRELRAELVAKGHTFRGHSDTEVLLRLYVEEGTAMLPRLNGIFAFALWDERRQELFVARDAFGVKPLYVATTPEGTAFASEMKGLLPLLAGRRELDVAALHSYLSLLYCAGDGTAMRGVRKLNPGEAMLLSPQGHIRRWTWYTLPSLRAVQRPMSEREAVAGTEAHLRAAVQRQMVADVPLGAFLSGGLDSSAVVAFAREVHPIQCFTIRNEGGQDPGFVDDLPYAQRVAAHLGVPLAIVDVNAASLAEDLRRVVVQLDEPLIDTAPLNVMYISGLARANGIKVLLSGAGGDDVFSGYRRHQALRYHRLFERLPAGLMRTAGRVAGRLDQRRALGRRLTRLFGAARHRGNAGIASYFPWIAEERLLALYTPDARAALGATRATDPLVAFLDDAEEGTTPLARMLALEQRFFLSDFNLIFTDKMSMVHGVEARVPFLDVELVEFAARIPDRFKQHGAEGKWVLKRAMEPYLPHDVIYRAKTGFGGPMRRWLGEGLRSLMLETLSPEALRRRGVFDPAAVQRLIADNQAGVVDASYALVGLMSIELWCQTYLDVPA